MKQPFDQSTRLKMAACEALGLSYWADHPSPGRVWAVDSNQKAHVVRVYRKEGVAALQHVGPWRTRIDWDDFRRREVKVSPQTYDVGPRVTFEAA